MRKNLQRKCIQPGYVEAFEEAPIFARVPGYVARLAVDIGDEVHGPRFDSEGHITEPGQVLAELAVPELHDALHQKEAQLAQAEAAIDQAVAAVAVANSAIAVNDAGRREAEAMLARTGAEAERTRLEKDRIAELAKSMAVTQKLADEARIAWEAAEASKREAQARLEAAAASLAGAEAGVLKAQSDEKAARAHLQVVTAELDAARTMVEFATLRAPFDGIVTQRNVDTGHYVEVGNGAMHPAFVVVQADRLRVFLDVPEGDAALVGADDAAEVIVDALADRSFQGKVARTSWSLNATTRTLRTEVDIPNPDRLLRPGMFAHVTVVVDQRENALVVPAAAVAQQGLQAFCVAVRDGRAVRLPVTLGLRVPGEMEILSGLNEGELLVAANVSSLADGTPVDATAAPSAK